MPAADTTPARHGPTRAFPRTLLLIAAALLVARIGTAVWEARRAPESGGDAPAAAHDDRVRWVPAELAVQASHASGRPVLYDFTADWCPPCQLMKRELFADPAHAASLEALVVPVRVLDRMREEGRNAPVVDSLQRAFGIEAFPTLVVARPGSGRFEKLEGFRGAAATLDWVAGAAADGASH